MHNYIYELLQAPLPENEWTTEWDINERPNAFPIAGWIGKAQDRDGAIDHLSEWLGRNRLGHCVNGAFSVDTEAVDRYFEGRFATFQQAIRMLQRLDEMEFIHEHDWVQQLIDLLCETFTQKHGDYVLWGDDMVPTPFDEFLRKAAPGTLYYFGAVLDYKY